MDRGNPNGKQPRLGSLVLRSTALNFSSAQGVNGAPPSGNSLGSNFSTSQTPERSGVEGCCRPVWACAASERVSSAIAAAPKKIKGIRTGAPEILEFRQGELARKLPHQDCRTKRPHSGGVTTTTQFAWPEFKTGLSL